LAKLAITMLGEIFSVNAGRTVVSIVQFAKRDASVTVNCLNSIQQYDAKELVVLSQTANCASDPP
jgi:hypothetical protein